MWSIVVSLCLFAVATADNVEDGAEENVVRDSKLSIFQVVKFANVQCTGSSKNGTCFTKAECDNIDGTSSGTCADGFGVCCIKTITAGQSSSVNNTYISMGSDQSSGSVTYTICPCSDDICRIKFDFLDFTLAGPNSGVGTFTDVGSNGLAVQNLQEVGRCVTDQFQIVSPSGRSSPLICGENDNQHMIIDSCSDECLTVRVGLGATTTATRDLDIRVMQYRCGEESGGPPGCLQYFENTSGKIRSFNFPDTTAGTAITYNYAIHLVNQHYKACIRRANSYEVICYAQCTWAGGLPDSVITAVTQQGSFGTSSVTGQATSYIGMDTHCSQDYIWIPFIQQAEQFDSTNSAQDVVVTEEARLNPIRVCGNMIGTEDGVTDTEDEQTPDTESSICTNSIPFELGVEFDDREFCTNDEDSSECESIVESESKGGGGGILGFSLCYVQHVPPIS